MKQPEDYFKYVVLVLFLLYFPAMLLWGLLGKVMLLDAQYGLHEALLYAEPHERIEICKLFNKPINHALCKTKDNF